MLETISSFLCFSVPLNPTHDQSISAYPLDQNILAHPRFNNFRVPTRIKYSGAPSIQQFPHTFLVKLFLRTHNQSISACLLDQNILAHPQTIHFCVPSWAKYSSAPTINPFPRTYLTRIIYHTHHQSISAYLLDQKILAHPPRTYSIYMLETSFLWVAAVQDSDIVLFNCTLPHVHFRIDLGSAATVNKVTASAVHFHNCTSTHYVGFRG